MDTRGRWITYQVVYKAINERVNAREREGLALISYEDIRERVLMETDAEFAELERTANAMEGGPAAPVQQQAVTQTGGARPEAEIAPKPCPVCGSAVEDQTSVVAAMKKKNPKATTPPKWSCTNEACPGGKGSYSWGSWDDWPKEWG